MKKTLYLKFLVAYLIFSCFGFIAVATFSSSLTLEHETRETAETLYKEASLIAKTYASDLYNNQITIESAHSQLNAISTYLSASIWIVNPSGTVVVNSQKMPDVTNPQVIENFDPAVTSDSYYITRSIECLYSHYFQLQDQRLRYHSSAYGRIAGT